MIFDENKVYGLTYSQADKVMRYMEHQYRMEDVGDFFTGDDKFLALSDKEQVKILDTLAYDVDDRIAECSNWYDCADDVIREWKQENGWN